MVALLRVPFLAVMFWVSVLWAGLAFASPAFPVPPCAGAGVPDYPGLSQPAHAQLLEGQGAEAERWQPPACTGWTEPGYDVLMATTARFRHDGDAAQLLDRFARVSTLTQATYWSSQSEAWRPLATMAVALTGPGGGVRDDFSGQELLGGPVFYRTFDPGIGTETTYRLRVLDALDGRLVVALDNAAPVIKFAMRLLRPGDLQTLFFFEREAPGVWTYYSLLRVQPGASDLLKGRQEVYLRRAQAFLRHYTGEQGQLTGVVPQSASSD